MGHLFAQDILTWLGTIHFIILPPNALWGVCVYVFDFLFFCLEGVEEGGLVQVSKLLGMGGGYRSSRKENIVFVFRDIVFKDSL